MSRHKGATLVWVALQGVIVAFGVACDDKKPNLAPVATASPSSSPPPAKASVKKFAIDDTTRTDVVMSAPKEKIKVATTSATGLIDVDPSNLGETRGEVKIDLATMTASTFPEAEKNSLQTTHARTWLEVGDGESGKLDEKTKETHRYAVYAIRGIDQPSATDLAMVSPTKDGADEVRRVTLTTKGELLVHGRKVERAADVEVTFRYDVGAPATEPKSLGVKTRAPLRVVLAEHDVKPRDGVGKIAKGAFHLLGTKVADEAEVTLDLRASRRP